MVNKSKSKKTPDKPKGTIPVVKPKILIFDIETTDLKGNKGHLLTLAAKYMDEEDIFTWRIDDHPDYGTTPKSFMNDSWMVKQFIDLVHESDMLVGQFIDRFDIPFINTRALAAGINPLPQIRTVDTWKVMRSTLALTSNRLKTGAAFLNRKDEQKMDSLDISDWMLAEHGDRKTITEMLKYNVQDVIATESLYKKLRPLIKNHPNVAAPVFGGDPRLQCPACASMRTTSTGSYYTKTMSVKRRRCKDCGTPFEESRSKK